MKNSNLVENFLNRGKTFVCQKIFLLENFLDHGKISVCGKILWSWKNLWLRKTFLIMEKYLVVEKILDYLKLPWTLEKSLLVEKIIDQVFPKWSVELYKRIIQTYKKERFATIVQVTSFNYKSIFQSVPC